MQFFVWCAGGVLLSLLVTGVTLSGYYPAPRPSATLPMSVRSNPSSYRPVYSPRYSGSDGSGGGWGSSGGSGGGWSGGK